MKTAFQHFINVATFTSITVIVVALLAPPILEGQTEARTWMAYSDVRQLHAEYSGEAPREPVELERLDPWKNPYVIQAIGGQVRVTSAGRNGVIDGATAESDDIWSGMPTSPMEPFREERRRGWIRAFSIGILLWCAFIAAYWWSLRVPGAESSSNKQSAVRGWPR